MVPPLAWYSNVATMSRSSAPFNMPEYHIQLKSVARRSLAPGAGAYCPPPAPRPPPPPRPCAPAPGPAGACAPAAGPAGACAPAAPRACALAVDATPIARTQASETSRFEIAQFLRDCIAVLRCGNTDVFRLKAEATSLNPEFSWLPP